MSITDEKKQAGRADWRIHELNGEMMAALEESGGEVTPEVEAIEARIAKSADDLAELAVKTRAHAKAMVALCRDEKRRVDEARAYYERLGDLANRWLRTAALEKGDRFEVGTHRVSLQAPKPRVVLREDLSDWTIGELVARGLGRQEFKLDRRATLAAFKTSDSIPGVSLEYPEEKVVVVR